MVALLVEGVQNVQSTNTEKSQVNLSQRRNGEPEELRKNAQGHFGSFYDFFHQNNAAEGRVLDMEQEDDRDKDSQPELSNLSKIIPKVPKYNKRPLGNVVSGNRWSSSSGAFNPYSTFFNGFNNRRFYGGK